MLTIRLRRVGKKGHPEYRVIVQEKTSSPYGQYVERVGHYNPGTKTLSLDKEKVAEWLSKGAQPSNTVAKLLTREKVELPAWVKIALRPERPAKKELKKKDEKPAAPGAAPAAEGEAPAEAESKVEEKAEAKEEAPKPEAKEETKTEDKQE